MELNQPRWTDLDLSGASPFQEVWHLLVTDPGAKRSCWLRFTILLSANRFRRVGEISAVLFSHGQDARQVALKQGFDIGSFTGTAEAIRLGTGELTEAGSKGVLRSKGRVLEWDFRLSAPNPDQPRSTYRLIPGAIARLGFGKTQLTTVRQAIPCEGTLRLDGETLNLSGALATQRHVFGSALGQAWFWAQGDHFTDTEGKPVDFGYELLTYSPRVAGRLTGLRLSATALRYQGQTYWLNSYVNPLRLRSTPTPTEWAFRADRGELSFHGAISAEHRDFAGLTFEDTDGSLVYCSSTLVARSTVRIFRRGKLEATLESGSRTALEFADRVRSPYVSLLT